MIPSNDQQHIVGYGFITFYFVGLEREFMQVIRNLFRKNRFQEGDIVYLQRHDRKTLICLADGRVITTYEPLKNVMTELSSDVFENINKGIVINHAFVDRDIDGFVVLTDGSGFSRRKKPLKKVESPEELSPEERLKKDIRFLVAPGVRIEKLDDPATEPTRNSEWKPDGNLRQTAVFEAEGGWVQIEFTPVEKRVFSGRTENRRKRRTARQV